MSKQPKNYYAILGVSQNATNEEIVAAYFTLGSNCDPNTNPGDKQKAERFKEIDEAHAVLSDLKKRSAYDQFDYPSIATGKSLDAQSKDFIDYIEEKARAGNGGTLHISGAGYSRDRYGYETSASSAAQETEQSRLARIEKWNNENPLAGWYYDYKRPGPDEKINGISDYFEHRFQNMFVEAKTESDTLPDFWKKCMLFVQENPSVVDEKYPIDLGLPIIVFLGQTPNEIALPALKFFVENDLISADRWMKTLITQGKNTGCLPYTSSDTPLILTTPPEQSRYLLSRHPEWKADKTMIDNFASVTELHQYGWYADKYGCVDFFFEQNPAAQRAWVEKVLTPENDYAVRSLTDAKQNRVLQFVQGNPDWQNDKGLITLLSLHEWYFGGREPLREAASLIVQSPEAEQHWMKSIMTQNRLTRVVYPEQATAIIDEIKRAYGENPSFRQDPELVPVAKVFCEELRLDKLRKLVCDDKGLVSSIAEMF